MTRRKHVDEPAMPRAVHRAPQRWRAWLGMAMLAGGALAVGFAGAQQQAPAEPADAPATTPGNDASSADDNEPRPFLVFDAMMFKQRPDMARFGMRPLHVVYAQDLWTGGSRRELPSENAVRAVARRAHRRGELVCIDIEHWPTFDKDNQLREDSLRKYQRVADWFHAAEPGLRLGYYAVLPPPAYKTIARRDEAGVRRWRQRCAESRALAPHVDVVFPSRYTLSDDPQAWQHVAETTLEEANQYDKQVYAFLWPRFHQASERAGEPIPGDFWRLQLETCLEHADGVVIWGGYQEPWDEEAEWWQQTREFLEALRER